MVDGSSRNRTWSSRHNRHPIVRQAVQPWRIVLVISHCCCRTYIHSHLNHRDNAVVVVVVVVVNEAQNKTQRHGLRHGWGLGTSIQASREARSLQG